MHHFDPLSFLIGKVLSAALSAAWNYGRQLVQAVAVCYFVLLFVGFYVSQPRPASAGRAA